MNLERRIGVVGSRDYSNWVQLSRVLDEVCQRGDILVSGGAVGADSLAQRYAKERGLSILVVYPDYPHEGRGAAFARNRRIVESCNHLYAFYASDKFQQGGTRNSVEWAQKLGIPYTEIKEQPIS